MAPWRESLKPSKQVKKNKRLAGTISANHKIWNLLAADSSHSASSKLLFFSRWLSSGECFRMMFNLWSRGKWRPSPTYFSFVLDQLVPHHAKSSPSLPWSNSGTLNRMFCALKWPVVARKCNGSFPECASSQIRLWSECPWQNQIFCALKRTATAWKWQAGMYHQKKKGVQMRGG